MVKVHTINVERYYKKEGQVEKLSLMEEQEGEKQMGYIIFIVVFLSGNWLLIRKSNGELKKENIDIDGYWGIFKKKKYGSSSVKNPNEVLRFVNVRLGIYLCFPIIVAIIYSIIQNFGPEKLDMNTTWNLEQYLNDLCNLSIAVVIGTFTLVGIMVVTNKSSYISFDIVDVMESRLFKEKFLVIFIDTGLSILLYFWNCANINLLMDEFTIMLFYSLRIVLVEQILWICGKIDYEVISVSVSRSNLEYSTLDNIHRRYWKLDTTYAIEDKSISCTDAIDNFKYLQQQYYKIEYKTEKIEDIKYSSAWQEVKQKQLRIKASSLWGILMFILSFFLLFDGLSIMNYKINLETVVKMTISALVILGAIMLYGSACTDPRLISFLYYRSNIYASYGKKKSYYGFLKSKSRKKIRHIKNLLSFYKYVLRLDWQKKKTDQEFEQKDFISIRLCQSYIENSNGKEDFYDMLAVMMMLYFSYEFAEKSERNKVLNNIQNYDTIGKWLSRGCKELDEDTKLEHWMNTLISTIRIDVDENDITVLKNKLFLEFKEKLLKKNCSVPEVVMDSIKTKPQASRKGKNDKAKNKKRTVTKR